MSLIDHLESNFGLITSGWGNTFGETASAFQIVEMSNGVFPDIVTYSTLGLSNYGLKSEVSNNLVFQELFIMTPANFDARNTPSLLLNIGEFNIKNKKALLRGEVCDYGSGKVFEKLEFVAFYVAPPVLFPDEFFSYYLKELDRAIIISWLIPIYESEVLFIKTHGWSSFEELIERNQPDFFDLEREVLI